MTGYQSLCADPLRLQQNAWDVPTKDGFETHMREDRGIDQSFDDDKRQPEVATGRWQFRTGAGHVQRHGPQPQVHNSDGLPESRPDQWEQPNRHAGQSNRYRETVDQRPSAEVENRNLQACGKIPPQAGSVHDRYKKPDQCMPAPQGYNAISFKTTDDRQEDQGKHATDQRGCGTWRLGDGGGSARPGVHYAPAPRQNCHHEDQGEYATDQRGFRGLQDRPRVHYAPAPQQNFRQPVVAPNFPSMADLAQDASAGGQQCIAEDQDVEIVDSWGHPVKDVQRFSNFDEVAFPQTIMADLRKSGFPSPSPIQQYTWPLAMQGRDVIGVAATGSGKTLAFLLPAFAHVLEHAVRAGDPTLLVMAPTRELAVQIHAESEKFGRRSGVWTTCVYGGAPKGRQAYELRRGVHGVIGTPGRINGFMESNQLNLGSVSKLVLDEADRMLDMGFEPQIRKILSQVPQQRQTLFFTATWPKNVRRLASEFLRGPLQVQIGNRDELKGNQDIVQMVRPCSGTNEKFQVLTEVLSEAGVTDNRNCEAKAIVFCSTKAMCEQLAKELRENSFRCASIHGDKDQWERGRALDILRTSRIKMLIATDVAARGLDIKGITLVVNYDAPNNTEDYVHRIGRTGRAGQKGYAVSLITNRDAEVLSGIIDVMRRTDQHVPPEVERMAWRRRGGQRCGNQRFSNQRFGGGYSSGGRRQGHGHPSSNRFGGPERQQPMHR